MSWNDLRRRLDRLAKARANRPPRPPDWNAMARGDLLAFGASLGLSEAESRDLGKRPDPDEEDPIEAEIKRLLDQPPTGTEAVPDTPTPSGD